VSLHIRLELFSAFGNARPPLYDSCTHLHLHLPKNASTVARYLARKPYFFSSSIQRTNISNPVGAVQFARRMPSRASPSLDSPKDSRATPFLEAPWRPPRRSLSSGARSFDYSPTRSATFRDNLIFNAEKLQRKVISTFTKMSLLQKVITVLAFLAALTFGILFLVYNEKVFAWLAPLAIKWKNATGGWIILWMITFIVALPPLIGYSTCATIAGFVYGVSEGWLILASATVAGSTFSFFISRTVLRKYVERLVASDKRFAALTLTLKHDGLKLLVMVRLCPLPYSLSNGAMSTFPSVHPAMYALATAIITPKLLVHVFIGSRLAAIAKSGEKMSAGTRAINYVSIAVGATVGVVTGWYIYQKTMARARQLEEEEADNIGNTIRRTGMPPRVYSDDPEAHVAGTTLAEDDAEDDEIDYFDDNDEPAPKNGAYRDLSDAEDVFGDGDGQGDGHGISLHRQKK
jgi:uncharacterized membrane protein YdjX (TVP38/TMEM64 family)